MPTSRPLILLAILRHVEAREITSGFGRYLNENDLNWDITCAHELWENSPGGRTLSHFDAIITLPRQPHQVARLYRSRAPLVLLGNVLPSSRHCVVTNDDLDTGKQAANYFDSLGYSDFAYFGFNQYAFAREREQGFGFRVRELDLRLHPAFHCASRHRSDAYGHAAAPDVFAWIESLPPRCAVFCATDACARQLIDANARVGRAIPDELAVLGVNDDQIHSALAPIPISSIKFDAERLGHASAVCLHRLLDGRHKESTYVRVPPLNIVERSSTRLTPQAVPPFTRAMRFLRARVFTTLRIEEVARAGGMSRRQFELACRRHLGRSPYAEIMRIRLERAQRLLRHNHPSVEHVAHQSGFSDLRSFHSAFRKAFATTPAAYARQSGINRPPQDGPDHAH